MHKIGLLLPVAAFFLLINFSHATTKGELLGRRVCEDKNSAFYYTHWLDQGSYQDVVANSFPSENNDKKIDKLTDAAFDLVTPVNSELAKSIEKVCKEKKYDAVAAYMTGVENLNTCAKLCEKHAKVLNSDATSQNVCGGLCFLRTERMVSFSNGAEAAESTQEPFRNQCLEAFRKAKEVAASPAVNQSSLQKQFDSLFNPIIDKFSGNTGTSPAK